MNRSSTVNDIPKSKFIVLLLPQTSDTIKEICEYMINTNIRRTESKFVSLEERGWVCNLTPTNHYRKDGSVSLKYPQIDCNKWQPGAGKQLVHAVWWRYRHDGKPIPDNCDLSHTDADPRYIRTVAEPRNLNESRKYCHAYAWYVARPGEDRPRCPHRRHPCTGPAPKKWPLVDQDTSSEDEEWS